MSRARRSVSDKDIQQYMTYMADQKAAASEAGADGFSFDDVAQGGDGTGTGETTPVVDEKDLYE